jgi:probable rRNA maturation factor
MELDFNSFNESFNNYQAIYEALLEKTLKHLSLNFDPYISVTIVDNDYIHEINRTYRHKDAPTDVISFAFMDDNPERDNLFHSGKMVVLGEIYISYQKAEQQAKEYGHSLERELKFLFVHGLLHLLGYDHMNEKDEKIMFALQDEILA